MLSKELTIVNKLGLHARAASRFVSCTSRFASEVRVHKGGRSVDGKSIMSVMMLAAGQGSVLTVQADGPDEHDALAAVEKLINDGFGEGE